MPRFLSVIAITTASWLSGVADGTPMSYSGRVTSSNGRPLSGTLDLRIRFFRTATGGSELGASPYSYNDVVLKDGIFQIDLNIPAGDLHSIFAADLPTWIEIEDVTHQKTYPRQRFSPVPYALKVPVDGTSIDYDTDGQLTLGSVSNIQGRPVAGGAPSNNDVLKWNGTSWAPSVDNAGSLSLSADAPLTYNGGTGTLQISQASSTTSGYLSSSNWNTFNNAAQNAIVDGDFTSNGLMTRTGAGTYSTITDNSANWSTAYSERLQWDGGSTNLSATTARTSLGLGTIATQNANNVSITGGTLTGVEIVTPTIANDGLSGDKIHGGVISNFASTGIDDNADALAITIDSQERVGIGVETPTARLEVQGQVAVKIPTTMTPPDTTQTIDWAGGNTVVVDLSAATGNVTMSFSNAVAGAMYGIRIIQGAVARNVIWPASVKWPGGTAPVISTGNGAVDFISMFFDGTNYYAAYGQDYK